MLGLSCFGKHQAANFFLLVVVISFRISCLVASLYKVL